MINIIENIWAILKNKVRRRAASNLEELRTIFEEEFIKIPDSVILNSYESIPKRISEVLQRILQIIHFSKITFNLIRW